jgi:hypothetical protein
MHVSSRANRLRRTVRLPVIAAALILPGLVLAQPTDDAAKCQAAAGSYLTGTVVSGPRFKPGAPLHGTYLSHTHLTLRGDADGGPMMSRSTTCSPTAITTTSARFRRR